MSETIGFRMPSFMLLRCAFLIMLGLLPAVASAQPADPLEPLLVRGEELAPLNSLVISYRGEVVAERYYRGMKADRAVNMKSVSKTLLSPLVGIAIRDSLLEGPDQRLAELLPDYFEAIDDPHRESIRLHHLLTMTTGLEGTSVRNYGAWVTSDDWVQFALDQPVECRPGACMTYSTGNTHLLSVILSRVSGKDLRAYARDVFFGKLGIPVHSWDRDPQGYYLGGNNMALRPRDMVRFGEVFLNRGWYGGEQLVPASWIEQSWKLVTTSRWNGHRYGYLWWSRVYGGERTYFAWGYGGQYIFIVPSLDLVVAVTSSLTNRSRRGNHNDAVQDFLAYEIIPAIKRMHANAVAGE